MVRDAALGSLVAALIFVGCSSGHREPQPPSSALTYEGTIGSNPQPMEAPPQEKPSAGPRLVRRDAEMTRKLDQSAITSATESNPRALREPAIGGGPPPTVEPTTSIPSPPATLSFPPRAGVDAALAVVPRSVPAGHLDRDRLEEPLRDRARFVRCAVPRNAEVHVDAVIYNGAAVGVDVRANPRDLALEFCVEQVVRETSWVQEPAVNRVSLKL